MKQFSILGALVVILSSTAAAQMAPQFDAVSIKPSAPDAHGGGFNLSPGHLNAKNQSLRDLVSFAWDLQAYQLSGGPSWAETDRYEVIATFPASTTNHDRALMMQSMLADRFGLTIRHDSKEISGYALTAGRNGHKLHSPVAADPGMMLGRSRATGQRTLTASSQSMANFASILSDLLGRPVEDRTGIAGQFDFSMEWTPDPVDGRAGGPGGKVIPPPDPEQTGPTIFTAIQETLGLKLETAKVKIGTVIIEKAEKPSAN